MDRVRGWVRARPMIWLVGTFVIALIVGSAIGGSGKSGLEDEKEDLQAAVGKANRLQGAAEYEAAAEVARIHRSERKILGHAKAEAEELENVEAEIAAKEGRLSSVEASLEGAQQEKALSAFGEGIVKAEVDFIPGTYEAPGGPGCYWAMLNTANTNDIAANEFAPNSSQQIVSITTPYFQSSECGQWKRIGE